MKNRNIELIIESAIKDLLFEIENKYAIIENKHLIKESSASWLDWILDAPANWAQALVSDAADSVSLSEDEQDVILMVLGGAFFQIMRTVSTPLTPGANAAVNLCVAFLYWKIYTLLRRIASTKEPDQAAYLNALAIGMGIIAASYTVSGISGAALASGWIESLVNQTGLARTVATDIARPLAGMRAIDIDEALEISSLCKQRTASATDLNRNHSVEIEIKLEGTMGERKLIFLNEKVGFIKKNGINYVMVPKGTSIGTLNIGNKSYTEINLDTIPSTAPFTEGTGSQRGVIDTTDTSLYDTYLETDVIFVKDGYADPEIATLNSEIKTAADDMSSNFTEAVNAKEMSNLENSSQEAINDAKVAVRSLQTGLDSVGSTIPNEQGRAIFESLDADEVGEFMGDNITLTPEEITNFKNAVRDDSFNAQQRSDVIGLQREIDNLETSKKNTENPDGPQKKAKGNDVEAEPSEKNELSQKVDAVKKASQATIEKYLKSAQTKVNKSLETKPLTYEWKIKNSDGTELHKATLVVFGYRSPGTYIAALKFDSVLGKIDKELAELAAERQTLKSSFSAYQNQLDPNPDGTLSIPSVTTTTNANTGSQTSKGKLPTEINDAVENYNRATNRARLLINERDRINSLSANQADPGVVPFALDSRRNPELEAHLNNNAGLDDNELMYTKEARKRAAMESTPDFKTNAKNSLWYHTIRSPAYIADFVVNNRLKYGVIMVGVDIMAWLTGVTPAYRVFAQPVVATETDPESSSSKEIVVVPQEAVELDVARDIRK
jgi:hypothetical protein